MFVRDEASLIDDMRALEMKLTYIAWTGHDDMGREWIT